MITANINEPVPLQILLVDGRTDLYGRVKVFDSLGVPVATLNTTTLTDGQYSVDWTPSIEGYYSYVGEMFFDVGRTLSAGYELSGELIEVTSQKDQIARLLGLEHSNSVVDMTTYDVDGNLTSSRLRCYDTAGHAVPGGTTGLLYEYQVTATYSTGQMATFSIKKVL